jgi:hypothetical protein
LKARAALVATTLLAAFLLPASAQQKSANPAVASYLDRLMQGAPPVDAELLVSSEILRLAGWTAEAQAARRLWERRGLEQALGTAGPMPATLAAALQAQAQREAGAAPEMLALRRAVLEKSIALLPGDPAAPFTRSFRNESRTPIKAVTAFVMREGGLFLECRMEEVTGGKDPVAAGGLGELRCIKRQEDDAWRRLDNALSPLMPDRVLTTFATTRIHFAPDLVVTPSSVAPSRGVAEEANRRLAQAAPPESASWPAPAPAPAPRAEPGAVRPASMLGSVHVESPFMQSLLAAPVSRDLATLRLHAAYFRLAEAHDSFEAVESIAAHLLLRQILQLPPPELPPTLAAAIQAQGTRPADASSLRTRVLERSVAFLPGQPLMSGETAPWRLPFRNDSGVDIWSFSGVLDLGAHGRFDCEFGGFGVAQLAPGDTAPVECKLPGAKPVPGTIRGAVHQEGAGLRADFRASRIKFVPWEFVVSPAGARFERERGDAEQHLELVEVRQRLAPEAWAARERAHRFDHAVTLGLLGFGLILGVYIGARSPRPGEAYWGTIVVVGVLAFFAVLLFGSEGLRGYNLGNLEGQIGAIVGGISFFVVLALAIAASLIFAVSLLLGGLVGTLLRKRAPQGVPMKR